jgi:hypothetical protein
MLYPLSYGGEGCHDVLGTLLTRTTAWSAMSLCMST